MLIVRLQAFATPKHLLLHIFETSEWAVTFDKAP